MPVFNRLSVEIVVTLTGLLLRNFDKMKMIVIVMKISKYPRLPFIALIVILTTSFLQLNRLVQLTLSINMYLVNFRKNLHISCLNFHHVLRIEME